MKLCPTCWKTDCSHNPYNFVEIDNDIADVIIMLNQKNYKTLYCCAGHDRVPDQIYITFNKWCIPKNFNPFAVLGEDGTPVLGNKWKWISSSSQLESIVPRTVPAKRPSLRNPAKEVTIKRDFTKEEAVLFLKKRRAELRKWALKLPNYTL